MKVLLKTTTSLLQLQNGSTDQSRGGKVTPDEVENKEAKCLSLKQFFNDSIFLNLK